MVVDESLLAPNPQSPRLWNRVSVQVRPKKNDSEFGGELHTLVKKYRRENDIWMYLELLKWMLFCPDTYITAVGNFGENAEEVFALADLCFDYLDMGPAKTDAEFDDTLKRAYEMLSHVYKTAVVDFYSPHVHVYWRHSALHFYLCGSIMEWQTWVRTGRESRLTRTFPRPVLSWTIENQAKIVEQWAMMDKRKLTLATVTDMIGEEQDRRINTELQLRADAVHERGVMNGG